MRDVIVATQQVEVEIRLEVRGNVLALLVEEILIAVERVERRVLPDALSVLEQRKRIERVVVVEENDVVAASLLDADVGVRRDASVIGQLDHLDAIVIERVEGGRELLILRAGIQQKQLPIAVELPLHRANHVTQKVKRRAEQWNDDAEPRAKAIRIGICVDAG